MLEEPVEDADDLDVLTDLRDTGAEAADAPDKEIYVNTGAGGHIKLGDYFPNAGSHIIMACRKIA